MNNRPQKKWRRVPGFSLIELMIVITLIGLMMAGAAVFLMGRLSEGEIKSARTQAYEISKQLDIFRLDHGRYPSTGEGLQALVNPPKGQPYLERMPKDPWGNEFIYTLPGEKNGRLGKPDVRSKGPDAVENTDDDVGNWPEGE